MIRFTSALALVVALAGGVAGSAQRTLTDGRAQRDAAPLAFRIDEGRNINAFVRDGQIAAHLLLRSGDVPRILSAFPAGNSAVGLWFDKIDRPATWTLDTPPMPSPMMDAKGRPLHAVQATASIDVPVLRFRQAVLSSIRVLRDYEALGKAPAEILVAGRYDLDLRGGPGMVWTRDRLDGAAGYILSVRGLDGTVVDKDGLRAGKGGHIRIAIVAGSGETPLIPLGGDALLTAAARNDPRARNALSYLSYKEKFLAGSWRFDTYFGRDTLMSLRLLMPVLQPAAVEDGIGAVLARLAANGEVAHEEDIGEFAVLRNAKEGRGRIATPVYDYAMVDDDFMLAPVARAWLLDAPRGRARAAAFLAAPAGKGLRQGDLIARNFAWVVDRTAAFAGQPGYRALVAIKAGRLTGQWRDSEEGLGRGRYAYDVNAVWVPAALAAIERFAASGLLDRYGTPEDRAAMTKAATQAQVWQRAAPRLFAMTVPNAEASADIAAYARKIGVPSASALASLGTAPLAFNALSLDDAGKPVPVVHSDDGFALLFGTASAADLDRSVDAMMRPFPAGLMTDIGLLVANPAFAPADVQGRFGATAYHGTVVWSWQQAILAAGLDRQLARSDLPAATRGRLVSARARLWRAIDAAGEVRTSELWSWAYANGRYTVAPFGASSADVDESNAAQLWSTVFLALRPPPALRPRK
ncbi:hypothetical protein U1737_09325 [Sphingomonas sp. LB3N6]|uniref:hypothetical protein n=1 Tax=Sphingomonas fucosidasi TaxID=3096164 RepID=UPI002FC941E6